MARTEYTFAARYARGWNEYTKPVTFRSSATTRAGIIRAAAKAGARATYTDVWEIPDARITADNGDTLVLNSGEQYDLWSIARDFVFDLAYGYAK